MKQKYENKQSQYILWLYLKKILIKLLESIGMKKYIKHYCILVYSLIEIASMMIDIFLYENHEIKQCITELSILGFIIVIDLVIVVLIKVDMINQTLYKIITFIIVGTTLELFIQDRQKQFRLAAFFMFLQISTLNLDSNHKNIIYSLITLIIFAQVRYSTVSDQSIINIIEFLVFQLAIISLSFIFQLSEKEFERGKEFLNIKSQLPKNDDPFLSNRQFLNRPENHDNFLSNDISQQIHSKKNPFDQSSLVDKSQNNKRSNVLNFQESPCDISYEQYKNTQVNGDFDRMRQTSYGFEYDLNKKAYILKDERKGRHLKMPETPLMDHFFSKFMNVISVGIVVLNQNKQQIYCNSNLKKFLYLKGNNDCLYNLLQIPLSMLTQESKGKQRPQQNKLELNKSINQSGNYQQSTTQQKECLIDSILGEQSLMMQKQRTKQPKSKLQTHEKYGSVLYNQYEPSKGSNDLKNSNSQGIRRIYTVEVMSTDNNSIQQQRQINSFLVQEQGKAQSNLSNNFNYDVSQNQQNSNLSVPIAKNQVRLNNSQLPQKERPVSPQCQSNENIVQELNSSAKGIPFSYLSPQNLQSTQGKDLTKSQFNKITSKRSLMQQQGSLHELSNSQPKNVTYNKRMIPQSIDRLFQHSSITLNDVIDFLLQNTKSQDSYKFKTDYHIEQFSDEDTSKINQKNSQLQPRVSQNNNQKTNKGSRSQNILKIKREKENNTKSKTNPNTNDDYFSAEEVEEENNDYYDDEEEEEEDIEEDNENPILEDKEENQQKESNKSSQQRKSLSPLQKRVSKQKKKNVKKPHNLYQYYIKNNYLHIYTNLNLQEQEGSENDKEQRFIEIKLSVLEASHSEEMYVLLELSDVTNFKKILDKDNLDIYKNKMLSSVSHELRTPLNCSIQLLDLLYQSDEVSDITKQTFVNPALNSNYLLLNIINDILDLAQISYGKFKMVFSQFELKRIIAECVNLVSLQVMQKDLLLELEIDPQIPQTINSDANRLRQVLLNLLNNALKFTQKGSITIKANLVEANLIQIAVEDTGCGIKQKDLTKIIGRFQYTEQDKSALNSVNGGLGLTIANNLATGLGGNRKIEVQSIYNVGSTFSFFIVNHAPNQKGCTYKQTNIFSKQIVNWECFSQFSQNLQSCIGKNISDYRSLLNQNSSSVKNKKNDTKFNDATMSLLRFNTEVLFTNVNMNASQSKLPQEAQPNLIAKASQRNRDQSNYDLYTNIANSHNFPANENQRFNRKFQLSMKSSQYWNQDQSQSECNSPLNPTTRNCPPTCNQTYKQFGENITELQLEDENQEKQQDNAARKRDSDLVKSPPPQEKGSRLALKNNMKVQTQFQNHQGSEKSFFPISSENKSPLQNQPHVNKNRYNFHSAKGIFNNDQLILSETDSFEFNQQTNSPNKTHQRFSGRRASQIQYGQASETDSCNINQNQQTDNLSKNLPNSFMCQEISQKRKTSLPNGLVISRSEELNELDNSLLNFDRQEQVIKILFKEDKERKNRESDQKKRDETKLSQIHERSNEHLDISSTNLDKAHQNKVMIDSQLKYIQSKQVGHYDLDSDGGMSLFNLDGNAQLELKICQRNSNEYNQNLDPHNNKLPSQNKQTQSKNELGIRETTKKQEKVDSLQQNVNTEQKIKELDKPSIKTQILKFNQERTCKCSNVLIVDDNDFNLYALELRLKSYGFVIDKATSGQAAIEFVQLKFEKNNPKNCHQLYQVIFMDIDMPIKNGYETTQEILSYFISQNIKNPTPISACSAYVQESEKIKAKESGMTYYITKPINQQMLEIVLQKTVLIGESINNTNI